MSVKMQQKYIFLEAYRPTSTSQEIILLLGGKKRNTKVRGLKLKHAPRPSTLSD
jgi:hypothetical protein